MTHPRVSTMTIDHHNDSQPFKSRVVSIDGASYFVARDVCAYYGFTADADGDYRDTLKANGVHYEQSLIDNLGEIIGPTALITQAGHAVLVEAANERPIQ